jgi:hypothetical protein
LQDQEKELNGKIKEMQTKISNDVSKDLKNLRFISDFIYEFFIGIALIGIMENNLVSGVFFFLYAFSHAIVANRKHHEKIFTDLDIEIELSETNLQKILTSLSIILGVFVGIIFNLLVGENMEMIFIMISFVT